MQFYGNKLFSPRTKFEIDMRAFQRLKMEWKHAKNVKIKRYLKMKPTCSAYMKLSVGNFIK